jgi:hypothetical protein
MNPIEADTARVDAMSGGILRKGTRRIARQLMASQVALSRAFDRLSPRSFRIDGSKDFKQRIVPSYVSSYFTSAVRTATRRVKSAQLWFDAGSREKSAGTALEWSWNR